MEKILSQNPVLNSRCPPRKWMDFAVQNSRREKEAIVIVVGCNKGDDFVELLEAFSGNSTYNSTRYIELLAKEDVVGFACPSVPVTVSNKIDLRPIRGYCIEAMLSTFQVANKIMSSLSFNPREANRVHMAMSAFPGKQNFTNHKAGAENAGLNNEWMFGGIPTVVVNVSNVDTLVEDERLDHIDFLSIDTEGHDASVILGTIKTLSRAFISVFEFEYHKVGQWAWMHLSFIIDLLDELGFDCFWQGNSGELWRLTGCWHRTYHTNKEWSNVVCAHRRLAAHSMFVKTSEIYM